mmetsp:Transcript_7485/g.15503  ORF Transcript_7485/g.15503 Transcript_7485/m.15503 type:complete len:344 (-) Transcript_7485:75-1106(-)|eukprot:CAMPEP_0194309278 /NCGR_PEP_ID=MMETSP0171-20130528/6259_1 /TAXON_ID=218684 /ORGANISM="Corethron pennatum, Strain L29A3" /LENGTH=343 /DNA_ID=CAMNT_0039062377 /DNA_START=123 /DNA_END=1154 /DNA_ORIENTATION=+
MVRVERKTASLKPNLLYVIIALQTLVVFCTLSKIYTPIIQDFAHSVTEHHSSVRAGNFHPVVHSELEHHSSVSVGKFRPVHIYSIQDQFTGPRSQINQDKIILALIEKTNEKHSSTNGDKKVPFFVDLAANDAIQLSNTAHLEENGWDGLCIEPNPIYWYNLAHRRKCIIVGSLVGGTEDGNEVEVTFTKKETGGIIDKDTDNKADKYKGERETRYTVSLLSVFKDYNVPKQIDYLSLDVEGAESLIMKNFPFSEYKFLFMTIERPKDDLKEVLKKNGYVFVADISEWCTETLWMHESSGLSKHEALTAACTAEKGNVYPAFNKDLDKTFYKGSCAPVWETAK